MSDRRDEHADEGEPLNLRRGLGGGAVPDAVRRRIVVGAVDRSDNPSTARTLRLRLFAGTSVAVVFAAVALFVIRARPVTPTPGSVVTAERATTFAIGPHRVALALGGQLRFDALDPAAVELSLERGRAGFEVAHLGARGHFRIRAHDLEVSVIGTKFDVERTGVCTEVRVQQGRVQVSPINAEPLFLTAGMARSFCPPQGAEGLSAAEQMVRDALRLIAGGSEADLRRALVLLERYRAGHPDGVFEEEALFYLAIANEKLGEHTESQALRQLFLKKFPNSPRGQKLRENP